MEKLCKNKIMQSVKYSDFFTDIQIYDTITSTNDVAKNCGKIGAKSGTVIIANHQTAGKGRLDRKFYSPPDVGIYMSIILRLNLPPQSALLITSAAAVAVSRAIKIVSGIETQIKWVNDIYLNDKKICGILAEASLKQDGVDFIVLGIGINLNKSNFPEEIKDTATFLSNETNFDKNKLIAEILNQVYIVSNDLIKKDFISEYKQRSCVIGKKINIISENSTEEATAIDISESGYLIVRTNDCKVKSLSTGEITIRLI